MSRVRRNIAIVLLCPLWIPVVLLGYCAAVVWPMLHGGYLLGRRDVESKYRSKP